MKTNVLLSTTALLFVLFCLNACKKEPETTYSDVSLIINTSCAVTGCHNSNAMAGNLDASSYAGLKNVLDNGAFNNRVLVQQSMPPNGTLSQADLDLLQSWKDSGFAE